MFAGAIPCASAQNTDVCLVDIALIFKNDATFNQKMEQLKQEAERFRLELQSKAQRLQGMSEQLKNYAPDSAEYKQGESQLAQESANLEVQRRSTTRDFVQREATLHFDTYVAITKMIATYCEERGIRLVLQYNSAEMKADDPETIMQKVNSNVIFRAAHKDITPEIIQRMKAAAPQVGNQPNNNMQR